MFLRLLYSLRRLYWRLTRPLTVGVRLMAVEEGKVLLVRHTYLDGWYLPGGGVQAGETLEAAICREAGEEVGGGSCRSCGCSAFTATFLKERAITSLSSYAKTLVGEMRVTGK